MKRILLVLFALISLNAFSQQMKVKEGSFKYVPGGVIDNKLEYTDGNDLPMALIKISTENIPEQERLRLVFVGNRATQIIKKPKTGSMWIYISAEPATFIDIRHPDYGTYKYLLPEELCDYCVYEMVLQYEGKVDPGNRPTNNAVSITADQDNALIYIDDNFEGEKEISKFLPIGSTHTWRIECELYHTETGSFTVDNSEVGVVIEKQLRPAYGFLNVTSKPETGAVVFVNNKKVGQTPYKSDRMPSGTYDVKVVKEMYATTEQKFNVTDGKTTDAIISMSARFVNATVTTDAASSIFIDEKYVGKGSWNGRLTEGSHTLEARKDKHKTSYKDLNVKVGADLTISLDAPTPICGFLEISSNPSKADIYIDDKHYGQTPKVVDKLLIGEHKLRLAKQGCADLHKTINIAEGETLSLNEKLQTGKEIVILTGQKGDKIYVDGNYIGLSPVTAYLSYGSREVKAERGSQAAKKNIDVKTTAEKQECILSFGKLIYVNSTAKGDKIFVDGKEVGTTPMNVDFSLGKHEVEVTRGKLVAVRTIDVTKDINSSLSFYPKKEPLNRYLKNGVNFITLNGAYSNAPQTSFGLTFGSVDKFGWFVSAMSNFDFTGFDVTDQSYKEVILTGGMKAIRLSVMGGAILKIGGPVCLRLGAGYGMRVKCWETIDGIYVEYTPDTYKGIDMSAGLQMNMRVTTISADVVTTNFKTMELKLGIGLNWKK